MSIVLFRSIDFEEWRSVAGHEGAYEVSNLGRVRSLDRIVAFRRVLRNGERRRLSRAFPGKLLTSSPSGPHGYRTVRLCGQTRYLHVLILEAFVGPRPKGLCGIHKDENGSHNSLDNLKWGTYLENNLQARSKRREGAG